MGNISWSAGYLGPKFIRYDWITNNFIFGLNTYNFGSLYISHEVFHRFRPTSILFLIPIWRCASYLCKFCFVLFCSVSLYGVGYQWVKLRFQRFHTCYLLIAAAGCKTGWVHGGGSCYRFITTEVSWNKAQGICRDLGGQLAVVDNLEKSAFITGYLYLHSGKLISLIIFWWITDQKPTAPFLRF